jgi:RNA polymerase sigma-32 factor
MAYLDGVGSHIIREASRAPYLGRDEELKLAIRWKNNHDEQALHSLANAHMRLVISLAAKFRHYGLSLADLIQEGHIGLLEAASRFDPDRDVRFSTYATWWIRASMQDYILRNWSIVRGGTSSGQKALFFNLRRLRARLSRSAPELSGTALLVQIAEAMGVSQADVEVMNSRLSGSDVSLNMTLSDEEDSSERGDFLVDDHPLPDELVEVEIDTSRRLQMLSVALKNLSDRELNIVKKRKLKDEPETLEAVGAQLGISKERVRQLEARAMLKLKSALTDMAIAF